MRIRFASFASTSADMSVPLRGGAKCRAFSPRARRGKSMRPSGPGFACAEAWHSCREAGAVRKQGCGQPARPGKWW